MNIIPIAQDKVEERLTKISSLSCFDLHIPPICTFGCNGEDIDSNRIMETETPVTSEVACIPTVNTANIDAIEGPKNSEISSNTLETTLPTLPTLPSLPDLPTLPVFQVEPQCTNVISDAQGFCDRAKGEVQGNVKTYFSKKERVARKEQREKLFAEFKNACNNFSERIDGVLANLCNEPEGTEDHDHLTFATVTDATLTDDGTSATEQTETETEKPRPTNRNRDSKSKAKGKTTKDTNPKDTKRRDARSKPIPKRRTKGDVYLIPLEKEATETSKEKNDTQDREESETDHLSFSDDTDSQIDFSTPTSSAKVPSISAHYVSESETTESTIDLATSTPQAKDLPEPVEWSSEGGDDDILDFEERTAKSLSAAINERSDQMSRREAIELADFEPRKPKATEIATNARVKFSVDNELIPETAYNSNKDPVEEPSTHKTKIAFHTDLRQIRPDNLNLGSTGGQRKVSFLDDFEPRTTFPTSPYPVEDTIMLDDADVPRFNSRILQPPQMSEMDRTEDSTELTSNLSDRKDRVIDLANAMVDTVVIDPYAEYKQDFGRSYDDSRDEDEPDVVDLVNHRVDFIDSDELIDLTMY